MRNSRMRECKREAGGGGGRSPWSDGIEYTNSVGKFNFAAKSVSTERLIIPLHTRPRSVAQLGSVAIAAGCRYYLVLRNLDS